MCLSSFCKFCYKSNILFYLTMFLLKNYMFHVCFCAFCYLLATSFFFVFSSACHLVLAKVGCFSVSVIFQYYSSSHHSITVISVSFSEVVFFLSDYQGVVFVNIVLCFS